MASEEEKTVDSQIKMETSEQNTEKAGPSGTTIINNNNNTTSDAKSSIGLIDPWYEFDESAPERVEMELHYTPSHFLRTHSKNNNPADVQTQVTIPTNIVVFLA